MAKKNKKPFVGFVLLLMMILLGTAYWFRGPLRATFTKLANRARTKTTGMSDGCPGCASEFTDVVAVQERAYRKERLKPQQNLTDLDNLYRKGYLAKLQDNPSYGIADMDHSRPYVLPVVTDFLSELANEYASTLKKQNLPYYPFVIISATRSINSAEDLMEENTIARKRSHHLNGKTIDISYKRFGGHEQERVCLIQALKKLRRNGKCYVKYESTGSLHLTVR